MAEIRLNASEWDRLSSEQKEQITGILEEAGLIKDSDTIIPDAAAPTFAALKLQLPTFGSVCVNLCNVGEATAKAACQFLQDPIVRAACVAAATAGGTVCRSACKGKGAIAPLPPPKSKPKSAGKKRK